jgi:hypothetical protein
MREDKKKSVFFLKIQLTLRLRRFILWLSHFTLWLSHFGLWLGTLV